MPAVGSPCGGGAATPTAIFAPCLRDLGTQWLTTEKLHLTKRAISHQLRQEVCGLGFQLTAKGEVTPAGRASAREFRKVLDIISAAAHQSSVYSSSGALTRTCPTWRSQQMAEQADLAPHAGLSVCHAKYGRAGQSGRCQHP